MKLWLLLIDPQSVDDTQTTLKDWIPTDPEVLIFLGALLAVSAAVFLWAIFFRKRTRWRHYDYPHVGAGQGGKGMERRWFFFGKRRHRRHRGHRRNPTLAEAGGLPPIRDEETTPGSS